MNMKSNFTHIFDLFGLGCTERIISHRGIIFQEIPYTSPLLNAVHQLNRTPDRTQIHFDRNNLSHIFLFESDGLGFAAIPCTYFRYAKGLTLNEHRAVRSYCLRIGETPTEDTLIRILRGIRAGTLKPRCTTLPSLGTNYSKFDNRRKTHRDKDYSALMARLGCEVRNFGSGDYRV
jgi:hypothetical protein